MGDLMKKGLLENKNLHCEKCEYVKCIEQVYRIFYCDNEARIDDMGKLGVGRLPKTSPVWCPKKGNVND